MCPVQGLSVDNPKMTLIAKRLSRLAKLCPHLFSPKHEWAIYVDNRADLTQSSQAIV
jgi:hypothetical protein